MSGAGLPDWRERLANKLAERPELPQPQVDHVYVERGIGAGPSKTAPCPTCGMKPRKPKAELESERPKVNFNIKVPKDALEDGHAILTELFAQARDILGREAKTPAYFVLVEVLYHFVAGHGNKQAA